MKNLRKFPNSCIDVYTASVNGKEDAQLKERLLEIRNQISNSYDSFETAFNDNTLHELLPEAFYADYKADLLGLYSYKSKVIRDLKKTIDNAQVDKIISTCQNCTIDSVSSLDHIIGKSKFPEYSVNGLNLFPSCSRCNGYKSSEFMHNGNRRFLNLYLDELPNEQYLFVDFTGHNLTNFDFTFSLANTNGIIDGTTFSIIENHYRFLHLFKRMKKKAADNYVSELANEIRLFRAHLSLDKIIDVVIQDAHLNMLAYGRNYFKSILEIALVQNPVFLSQFQV